MGIIYKSYLRGEKILSCQECRTHFATTDQIISKDFQGQHGKACLVAAVVNVYTGTVDDRSMTTGLHTVQDIHCIDCGNIVGWKYLEAFEQTQKYKEGHYILERALMKHVSSV